VKTSLSDIIKKANLTDETVLVGPTKVFSKSESGKRDDQITEDPVKLAEKRAEEILSKAQKKAKEIIASAQLQAKTIEESAKENGYAHGFQEAKKELEEQIEELKTLLDNFNNQISESIDEVKTSLIDLSIAVVKEILLVEMEKGDVERKIDKALDMVKASKKITVKISSELPKSLFEKLTSMENVQVFPMSNFNKMDVQIEADFGTLDLRTSSQVELFERIVRKAFGDM